jgi:hypothetical protein
MHDPSDEAPTRVTHVSEFKRDRDITLGIQTGILNAFLTGYGRSIGALFPSEKIEITEVDIQGGSSVVDGTLYKQDVQ